MWVRILSSAAALALLFGVLFWLPVWVICLAVPSRWAAPTLTLF